MKRVCENWGKLFPEGEYAPHLFDEFALRAQNVSAEVLRVSSPSESKEALLNLARSVNAKKVVAVDCPLTEAADILKAFRELGIEVYTDPVDIREHAETADIGISGVEFGVAETGSVCQDAYSIESRLVSTLPPIHVGVLNGRHIVPGIEEALGVVSQVFDRGYVSFITGPSRTADIERVLTIGVHGPSRFIVIADFSQSAQGAN